MAILTYPSSIVPQTIDWSVQYITQVYTSPFGGVTQTAEVPGARWAAKMSYSNLTQDELRQLSSFFIQLRGMSGRFYLYDFSLPAPQQGTIGAGRTISSVTDKTTITLNNASGLTLGDYIEVTPSTSSYKELKMVTNINGNTISVEPAFRVTPSGGEDVVFEQASCIMRLTSDNQTGWTSSGSIYLSNFTVECVEAF